MDRHQKIVSIARNPLRMELRPRRTPNTKNRGCASALVKGNILNRDHQKLKIERKRPGPRPAFLATRFWLEPWFGWRPSQTWSPRTPFTEPETDASDDSLVRPSRPGRYGTGNFLPPQWTLTFLEIQISFFFNFHFFNLIFRFLFFFVT